MKGLGKTLLFTVAILVLSLSVFPIAARMQEPGSLAPIEGDTCDSLGILCSGDDDVNEANDLIRQIVNSLLVLVAIIAAIFLIIGGLRYITAQGNEQDVQKAKATILYAIIGLIIIGLSAAIVNFVIFSVGGGQGNSSPPPQRAN